MQMTYESFAHTLRAEVPELAGIYDEHMVSNDEMLPHVFLGDVTRCILAEACRPGPASSALQQLLALLEDAMASSDDRLQELVSVSFIENLSPQDRAFAVVRALFGPHLERELSRK